MSVLRPFPGQASLYALVTILTAGCASTQSDLQRHAERMDSLQASAVAVTDAWLAGNASGTYTRATLERTFQLVEKERAAVASTPRDFALPAADAVARTGEELARTLAALSDAVGRADGAGARRRLEGLPHRHQIQP